MYGFICGVTDTDNINYCPKCGTIITSCNGDGTAYCDECHFVFGVVEKEDFGPLE